MKNRYTIVKIRIKIFGYVAWLSVAISYLKYYMLVYNIQWIINYYRDDCNVIAISCTLLIRNYS